MEHREHPMREGVAHQEDSAWRSLARGAGPLGAIVHLTILAAVLGFLWSTWTELRQRLSERATLQGDQMAPLHAVWFEIDLEPSATRGDWRGAARYAVCMEVGPGTAPSQSPPVQADARQSSCARFSRLPEGAIDVWLRRLADNGVPWANQPSAPRVDLRLSPRASAWLDSNPPTFSYEVPWSDPFAEPGDDAGQPTAFDGLFHEIDDPIRRLYEVVDTDPGEAPATVAVLSGPADSSDQAGHRLVPTLLLGEAPESVAPLALMLAMFFFGFATLRAARGLPLRPPALRWPFAVGIVVAAPLWAAVLGALPAPVSTVVATARDLVLTAIGPSEVSTPDAESGDADEAARPSVERPWTLETSIDAPFLAPVRELLEEVRTASSDAESAEELAQDLLSARGESRFATALARRLTSRLDALGDQEWTAFFSRLAEAASQRRLQSGLLFVDAASRAVVGESTRSEVAVAAAHRFLRQLGQEMSGYVDDAPRSPAVRELWGPLADHPDPVLANTARAVIDGR
ncbi:MAG: hypothetical protein DWQ36_21240 [Acidobacteria bacterium]|nr:MAG: hypothetical protein DWQ30_09810 [Acidobacteriota bacterium]REK01035.1 MAG: hypothetical protein DWQ36_21240 [Acidobacteriota bacterium]